MTFIVDRIIPFEKVKQEYFRWILKQTNGNKAEAARLLGLDRSTFYRVLKKMDPSLFSPDELPDTRPDIKRRVKK